MIKQLSVLFSTTLLLSACSTMPTQSYQPVATIPNYKSNSTDSTIEVRRDVGLMGSGCPIDVYIDGNKFGELTVGESVATTVSTGTHILSAKFIGTFCPKRLAETEVTIEKGQTKYYRTGFGAAGDFLLMPTLGKPIK